MPRKDPQSPEAREAARAAARRHYWRNKEACQARARQWKADNPERCRQNWQDWYAENPDKNLERDKRVGMKRQANPFTKAELTARLDEFNGGCAYCPGAFEHWDHYIPLSRGGTHSIDNLVPSCARCNLSKGGRYPIWEWYMSKGVGRLNGQVN